MHGARRLCIFSAGDFYDADSLKFSKTTSESRCTGSPFTSFSSRYFLIWRTAPVLFCGCPSSTKGSTRGSFRTLWGLWAWWCLTLLLFCRRATTAAFNQKDIPRFTAAHTLVRCPCAWFENKKGRNFLRASHGQRHQILRPARGVALRKRLGAEKVLLQAGQGIPPRQEPQRRRKVQGDLARLRDFVGLAKETGVRPVRRRRPLHRRPRPRRVPRGPVLAAVWRRRTLAPVGATQRKRHGAPAQSVARRLVQGQGKQTRPAETGAVRWLRGTRRKGWLSYHVSWMPGPRNQNHHASNGPHDSADAADLWRLQRRRLSHERKR